MSYCEIIVFRDGKPVDSIEYGNSWGGAAFIWSALFDKYLKRGEYDNWLTRSEELWKLAERADLPMFERAVMSGTFDYAIICRENFKQFVEHLREFVATYAAGNKSCHLLAWAEFIETCDAEAIGFRGTSVSENLWFKYDDNGENEIPYDLNSMDQHFEVYEELESAADEVPC